MRFVLVLLAACTPEHIFTLDDLPVAEWTGGLPVHGDGKLAVWVAHPPGDWSTATGYATFRCDGCTLGDDHRELRVAALDDGLPFGHLTFDRVRAELVFADGRVTLTSSWRSPDFELDAQVTGVLARRPEDIVLSGCVEFRALPPLRARDPRTHALLEVTGAPRDEDGRFKVTIDGTLGAMRRLPRACKRS